MRYANGKAEDLKIAYIGGGSKNWAWRLMIDLACEEQLSGTVKLYDIDYSSACGNRDIGNSFSDRPEAKSKWKYEAVRELKDAIKEADFIIISILPGTFKEMHSDVHLPEKYGIYQAVGDTVGPGGIMRAIRTVPIYLDFAENIKRYAPNAWVINYTNPMTLCTRALYAGFPEIKAFGCCHGVFHGQEILAHALKKLRGIEVPHRSDVRINVLGINHFTWIDKASYKNMDLMPVYKEFAEKYGDEGFEPEGKDSWELSVFSSANKVSFDLYKRYGVMVTSGDRHLAEFLPPWYLTDPEKVKQWKFHLTTVNYRIQQDIKREEYRKKVLAGEEIVELVPGEEEEILQIKALLGLGEMVTNVNMPNLGQIRGIPAGCVVETNAYISKDSIQPVFSGGLPNDIQNLVMRHVLNQETVLEACLKRDKELAFRAFLNDPLVTVGLKDARELFDQMLFNIRLYLVGWNV